MFAIKVVKQEEDNVTATFFLEKLSNGNVRLNASDSDGYVWSILDVSEEGIALAGGVHTCLGIGLGDDGYVLVEKE